MVSLKVLEGQSTYSIYDEGILSSTERTEMSLLAPCTHEEEDSGLTVHVFDTTSKGHWWNRIRSNDTDVVLTISVASTLPRDELWITFGSGKNVQNILALTITTSLGPDKASTLPMFHAPTGCDTVSSFRGRGKKTAWDVWNLFSQLTPVLKVLKHHPKRSQRSAWLCLRGLLSLYMTVKQPYESKRGAIKALFKEV